MAEVKLRDGDDVGKPEPRHASVTMKKTLGAQCGLTSSVRPTPRHTISLHRRLAVQRGILSIQTDLTILEANVQRCAAIAVNDDQQCGDDLAPVQIGLHAAHLTSTNLF